MQSTVETLTIPEIADDADLISAAIAYANAGFYIVAVEPDTKRPAAFYGKGWPHMSSRDPQEIAYWFAGSPYQLALHIGRSGAVAFDVDEPDKIPAILQRAFDECRPPFQSTRETGGRGHRIFAVPEGRRLGNSVGGLGRGWGDVRGRNGIIVVEPSFHTKHSDGGRYKWLTTGAVPMLPDYVAELLPEAGVDTEAATDAVVRKFMDEYTDERRGALLTAVLNKFSSELKEGSRHEALVRNLVWAMRESRLGWYPAQMAADTMQSMFSNAMAGERHPVPEFQGALAFAVAQALLIDPDERRDEASARLKARDAAKKAAIGVTSQDGRARPKQRPRDPGDYFYDKSAGIDMEMLVQDVFSVGPIAVGPNHDFWTYDAGVWRSNPKEVGKRVWNLLGPRYRGSHATNAEHGVLAEAMEIAVNPVSDYMNFANGMLEWRTGELHEHSPHYGSTVQFPLEWKPDALCPQFDDFLATIFSEDYVELAWQMLGYLMFSGNPHQKAFLFLGSGANGKGTLMRVIDAMLGTENCSSESLDDLNQNRFAAYSLFGKIANLAGDIDATYQTSTAAFKKLTGEDMYAGERKYGDRFLFKAWAVPVFSANKIPGSADASEGYLRRWIILKFDRTFSEKERIQGLSDRLITELPGIAVKAIQALAGVIDGPGFKLDGEVAQAKEEFAEAIDQVRQWMGECTITAPGSQVPRAKAYASYKFWAGSNGHRVLSASELYQRMNSASKSGKKIEKKIRGNRVFVDFEIVEFSVNTFAPSSDVLPDAFGDE
jgi:P4 family phage/plasmid primase-like protien